MFKQVVSMMEVPSMTLIRKLKLYGVQFYENEPLIYSLCKPCDYSYVFSQDFKFPVLGASSILTQSMPTFFKNFIAIKHLVEETHATLDEMFSTVDETQEILEENNEDPNPHTSPRKKQKSTSSSVEDGEENQDEE